VAAADVDPDLVLGARAVHLGGTDVTFGLYDEAFYALLDRARAAGTVVTMDLLSTMPDLLAATIAFLPHVDYVLPNEEQALAMTGTGDAESAAAALLAGGARGALITLGERGSLVATAEGTVRVPALKVDAVDTTGCGDAYCAGFVTGLLHGEPVAEAARWGTAAAALVATGLGSDAGLTDLDAVLSLLDEAPKEQP
jgi:sugar/nucleoside kinase (ribokinase family)